MSSIVLDRRGVRRKAGTAPETPLAQLRTIELHLGGEDGEVVATFRQRFDLLAETTAIAARHGAGNTAKSSKSKIWLHTEDSNSELQPSLELSHSQHPR